MLALLSLVTLLAAPAPKNVVECLLSFSDEVAPLDKMPVETRQEALKSSSTVIDQKNGYLSFKTDWDSQGQSESDTVQVAIFQRSDKKFVVAISRDDVSDHHFGLYEFTDGVWAEVTDALAPALAQSDFWTSKKKPPALVEFFYSVYRLPQLGTTITVSRDPWVRRNFDDGRDDISTARERAQQEAAEDEASASLRTVSLLWNARKGVFTRQRD